MGDTIDEMQAGRELDALVAEKVMGYSNPRFDGEWPEKKELIADDRLGRYAWVIVPYYSTGIAAAWQVTERLPGKWDLRRTILHTHWRVFYQPQEPVSLGFEAVATTAPLAICRAALKAVGVTDAP